MSFYIQDFVFTEFFLSMQCNKYLDGSRSLILRGNDLIKKIGKRVDDRDVVKIVDFLKKNLDVVALDFPYNEISDCGVSTLMKLFKEQPCIKHLNLIGNNIGPRGISYILELGEFLPLCSLRLSGNKFGEEGGKILSKLLYKNTGLKFLDLSDTHQNMSSLAYILTALMHSWGGRDTLKYIDIGKPLPQEFHQVCDSHASEFISQVLQVNKNLKELHIQQYQFDFRDMEIMLEGLFANTTLLCLNLNNNNIGDDGIEYLCKYLRTSPQLECLMVGANNFSDIGATALGFNLPFSKIKLLDITNNRITDEGMKNIFYTIKKTVTMRALFIWGNKLSHTSLLVLQRLYLTGLLDPNHTDVKLYCVDKQLHASWNSQANKFTHRFYCVSDYGHPPLRKILRNFSRPFIEPPINFRYHADDAEINFPQSEWNESMIKAKYFFPD